MCIYICIYINIYIYTYNIYKYIYMLKNIFVSHKYFSQIFLLFYITFCIVKIEWKCVFFNIYWNTSCFCLIMCMCRAFSNNLLHEIITQSPALFSRSFQILYISAQVFKYFALFCPFLTFFVLFLKNYMYALLLLSIIFRIYIYIYKVYSFLHLFLF